MNKATNVKNMSLEFIKEFVLDVENCCVFSGGSVVDEPPNMLNNYYHKGKKILEANNINNIKPPLGLVPKEFHERQVKIDRFNEVCRVISSYYNEGLKINTEWIEEYNELVHILWKS